MMEYQKHKGKKFLLTLQKLQNLGQIASLSFILAEMQDTQDKLSSDSLFQLVYESYDKLYAEGSRREVIIKFGQLKYAKRVNQ